MAAVRGSLETVLVALPVRSLLLPHRVSIVEGAFFAAGSSLSSYGQANRGQGRFTEEMRGDNGAKKGS